MKEVSELFNVNLRERIKGLAITLVGVFFTAVYTFYQANGIPKSKEDWFTMLGVGIAAGASYISITFFAGKGPSKIETFFRKK